MTMGRKQARFSYLFKLVCIPLIFAIFCSYSSVRQVQRQYEFEKILTYVFARDGSQLQQRTRTEIKSLSYRKSVLQQIIDLRTQMNIKRLLEIASLNHSCYAMNYIVMGSQELTQQISRIIVIQQSSLCQGEMQVLFSSPICYIHRT